MRRLLTFERLKWASFTHSTIYTILIAVWLIPGLHGWEMVFGLAHGIGWIAMSLACIAALRLRVIDLRLAVAVAVLGGVGPVHRLGGVRAPGPRRRRRRGADARLAAGRRTLIRTRANLAPRAARGPRSAAQPPSSSQP